MATQMTVWRPFAEFGELRQRVEEMFHEAGIGGDGGEHSEEKKDDYMRRERRFGSFSRSMTLPAGVKVEEIKSTTADGVLEVTIPLPKAEENKPVEIPTTAKES